MISDGLNELRYGNYLESPPGEIRRFASEQHVDHPPRIPRRKVCPIDEVICIAPVGLQRRKVSVHGPELSTRIAKSALSSRRISYSRGVKTRRSARDDRQQGHVDLDPVLLGKCHDLSEATDLTRLWPHPFDLRRLIEVCRPELHFLVMPASSSSRCLGPLRPFEKRLLRPSA